MTLILIIDVIVVAWLCSSVARKGFENTLPVVAFLLMLFPAESQLQIPGLFDLTTQRVVVGVLAILYQARGKGENVAGRRYPLPLKHLIILVMGWMVVSSFNSVVPEISFKSTLSQCFDYFVPYYIFARSVSKIETAHKICFGFVASMFVCSVFAFVEVYQGWNVTSVFPQVAHHFGDLVGGVADRGARAQSTFGHPILFGAALAMVIPMALYLLSVEQAKIRKTFLWCAILLMVLCIYQTESRGPWLALSLSLIMLLLLGRGKMRKYLTVIAVLTLVVLISRPGVWVTIANLYGETMNPNTAQGESYQWRYVLYGVAKRELSRNLGRSLWGYGPESFYQLGLTAPAITNGELHVVKVESCDSAVVELMMDTGYIGLLLVVMLLLKTALLSFRQCVMQPRAGNSLCLVLGINIVAFCFLMTNVELFGWGQQTYMLWIVIALAMVNPRFRLLPRATRMQSERTERATYTVKELVSCVAGNAAAEV